MSFPRFFSSCLLILPFLFSFLAFCFPSCSSLIRHPFLYNRIHCELGYQRCSPPIPLFYKVLVVSTVLPIVFVTEFPVVDLGSTLQLHREIVIFCLRRHSCRLQLRLRYPSAVYIAAYLQTCRYAPIVDASRVSPRTTPTGSHRPYIVNCLTPSSSRRRCSDSCRLNFDSFLLTSSPSSRQLPLCLLHRRR